MDYTDEHRTVDMINANTPACIVEYAINNITNQNQDVKTKSSAVIFAACYTNNL